MNSDWLIGFAVLVVVALVVIVIIVSKKKHLVATTGLNIGASKCTNSSHCGKGFYCCGKSKTGTGTCTQCPHLDPLFGKCLSGGYATCDNADGQVEVFS